MDLRPGDIVFGPSQDDRYTIVSPLGQGGFGIVFEIRDENGDSYALKTISTTWLNDTELQALLNDGRRAIEIRHPNVISVYYYHDGEQYHELPPYTIMELANGGNLNDLLDRQRTTGQPFMQDELQAMLSQLGNGMAAVNAKLVHRDIKPDNILIHNETLKISDFGLSKVVGASTRTRTFKGIQHIRYMAPEAWELERNEPSMDMYSMGIVFYELATLKHPYEVDTGGDPIIKWRDAHMTQVPADPRDHNPSISIGTAQLIMKMIEKRPQYRYASWEEVLERISSSASQHEGGPDVSQLVNLAIGKARKTQDTQLSHKKRERELNEFKDRVNHSFKEISDTVQKIVDAFNNTSETTKLEIVQRAGLSIGIRTKGGSSNELAIEVKYVYDGKYQLRKRAIFAWGYAFVPSGVGINLVLVSEGADDLYGSWVTLVNRHRIGIRPRRPRPEPFYFDFDELPRELQFAGTGIAHIYITSIEPFTSEHLTLLLGQIFQ